MDRSGWVAEIRGVLRNYFAPEAVDAILQRATRFTPVRRTDLPVGENIVEYDRFRLEQIAPILEMGAGFPKQAASILRMGDAALSRYG